MIGFLHRLSNILAWVSFVGLLSPFIFAVLGLFLFGMAYVDYAIQPESEAARADNWDAGGWEIDEVVISKSCKDWLLDNPMLENSESGEDFLETSKQALKEKFQAARAVDRINRARKESGGEVITMDQLPLTPDPDTYRFFAERCSRSDAMQDGGYVHLVLFSPYTHSTVDDLLEVFGPSTPPSTWLLPSEQSGHTEILYLDEKFEDWIESKPPSPAKFFEGAFGFFEELYIFMVLPASLGICLLNYLFVGSFRFKPWKLLSSGE